MPRRSPVPVPQAPAPQILSQQFPNYSQTTTSAPGAGFGFGGGMPFGMDFAALTRYMNQMSAYKAAQQAKEQAYRRQMAEREMAMREQQMQQDAANEAGRMAFAREQWQALQDKQNEMVPIYTTQTGLGPNQLSGSNISLRAMPGSAAAGYVPASMASQYSAPSQSQYQLGRTGGGPGAEWLGTGENRGTTAGPGQFDLSGNVVQNPAAQQATALQPKVDPFAEYDAYWAAKRSEEAAQPLAQLGSAEAAPDFSDVTSGYSRYSY